MGICHVMALERDMTLGWKSQDVTCTTTGDNVYSSPVQLTLGCQYFQFQQQNDQLHLCPSTVKTKGTHLLYLFVMSEYIYLYNPLRGGL